MNHVVYIVLLQKIGSEADILYMSSKIEIAKNWLCKQKVARTIYIIY